MSEKTSLERLADYQPVWLEYHQRYLRSLVPTRYGLKSGDPKLDLSYQTINRHMDGLLEKHFQVINGEAFQQIVGVEPAQSVDVPIEHTQEVYAVEVEDVRGME